MFSKLIFSILIISFVNSVYSKSYYTIIGSKQIRPNSNYITAVTLFNYQEPCTIRLMIENDNYKKTQEIVIQSDRTQLVSIPTGDMISGSNGYKLIAEGISGIIFRNETLLNLNEKIFSIFIQMDKGMYKPNDLVQFRVLLLDEYTKPIDAQSEFKVYITDANQNLIHQWNEAKPIKGVFSNKLQLSKYLVLGDWNINVEYLGEKKQKTFEVAKYVLPRFEVIIDSPRHQLYSDDVIRAKVYGKYTYGKLVRGDLIVSINIAESNDLPLLEKNLKITTEQEVIEFIIADLKLPSQTKKDFVISASLIEELTGQKQSSSTILTLHVEKYKIECINPSTHFHPGIPFEFNVKLTKYDGTPIVDHQNDLIINYGPTYNKRTDNVENHVIQNGIVPVELFIDDTETEIQIFAKYLNKETLLGIFSIAESQTGDYLRAAIKTEILKINKTVVIEVESTKRIQRLTYIILGRGNVIESNTVRVNNKKYRLLIMATELMLPRAQLIIFYIKSGGIIYTKLELEFTNDLFNEINILSPTDQVRPGGQVELVISTTPNSFVGLLGVDQSVLILKSGFDLSRQLVFNDLNEYNIDYNRNGSMSPKTFNVVNDFFEAGTVILSNAIENIEIANDVEYPEPRRLEDDKARNNIRTRTKFPETWIWEEIYDNFSGTKIIKKIIPDTITTWVLTGFSINPSTGLGMTQIPTKLQVFQPFFIALDLPYSIKFGETFAIRVLIFNYTPLIVNAQVKLHNDKKEFEFAEQVVSPDPSFYTKTVQVNGNDGTALYFLIRPNITGPLAIKVSAQRLNAGDSIERMLLVKPDGIRKFPNQALFVDLRNHPNYQEKFSVIVPPNAVPDSTKLELSVTGDIMGTSLKNLDSLIRMPSGCGEQNMLNFVPNIVILDYLTIIGQLTAPIETQLKGYMVSGYQNELNYARTDGSFSAFGKSDSHGSTWLTAYVIRSFNQAKKYIAIDAAVVNKSLTWLISVQANDGSFPEVGRVIHTSMQTGSGHGIALTAYTLISILEIEGSEIKYKANIDKTLTYLINAVEKNIDLYDLALISYAFQLTNHNSKAAVYNQFLLKAQKIGDRKWWGTPSSSTNGKVNINSKDIEITSYGLLATLLAGLDTDGLSIVRWLLHNRSSRGGFEATQDTVLGITALAAYSKLTSSKGSNVQISIKYDANEIKATVTEANALTLQQFQLPTSVREVSITATGNGFAIVELSNEYNINVDEPSPSFNLTATILDTSTVNQLLLSVCGSYIPEDGQQFSNMAIMEVELPSGYIANFDQFSYIRKTKNVKRVETKNRDTIVVIYFDNFGVDQICPIIGAFRLQKVADIKPVPVILYDYYDNTKKASNFYQIQKQTVLDVCLEVDCRALL